MHWLEVVWKQIIIDNISYNYEVSNLGQVRNKSNGYILTPKTDKDGYKLVCISSCIEKKRKTVRIHRMVGLMFIPNPDGKPEINHIDENKENNCVDNLEWVTSKENANHGTRNERAKKNNIRKQGKNHPRSKKVRCINTGQIFDTVTLAENWCNVSSGLVSSCCKGKRETAGRHPVTSEPLYWEYVKEQ